jgi:hypothetical protein
MMNKMNMKNKMLNGINFEDEEEEEYEEDDNVYEEYEF